MKKFAAVILGAALALAASAADPIDGKLDVSARSDGRHESSLAQVRALMRTRAPQLDVQPLIKGRVSAFERSQSASAMR